MSNYNEAQCKQIAVPSHDGDAPRAVGLPRAGLGFHPQSSDANVARSASTYRVLIVDDLRAVRDVIAKLVINLGHEVDVAECGQALEKLVQFRPDVVLSDISMPEMSGYELARLIRQRADMSHVLLVAMTGYDRESARSAALASGFDHYLTKPIDVGCLQSLITRPQA